MRFRLQWDEGFPGPTTWRKSRVSRGTSGDSGWSTPTPRSATVQTPDLVEPVKEDGKLVLRVWVRHRDPKDYGALAGQILGDQGSRSRRPGEVTVWSMRGGREPDALRHRAAADAEGRYRLQDIPRPDDRWPAITDKARRDQGGFRRTHVLSSDAEGERAQAADGRRPNPDGARCHGPGHRDRSSRETRRRGDGPDQSAAAAIQRGRPVRRGADRCGRPICLQKPCTRGSSSSSSSRPSFMGAGCSSPTDRTGVSHSAGGSPRRRPPDFAAMMARRSRQWPWVGRRPSGKWAPGRTDDPARSRASAVRSSSSTSGA